MEPGRFRVRATVGYGIRARRIRQVLGAPSMTADAATNTSAKVSWFSSHCPIFAYV
ncbi:MAG: hypothetical protein ABWK01_03830 [Infirmifilum sp.]